MTSPLFARTSLALLISTSLCAQDQLWYPGAKFDFNLCPLDIDLAELNGDGRADLVTVSVNVSVRFAEPGGSFGVSAGVGAGSGPFSVATSDLDADGNLDIVATDLIASSVHVLLGDGSGGFVQTDYASSTATTVDFGDFDGNAVPDLLMGTGLLGSVTVHLGDGAGGFLTSVDSPASPFTHVAWVAATDLDQDGLQDVVLSDSNVFRIQTLASDGTGALGPPIDWSFNPPMGAGALGDVNEDGLDDIVVEVSSSLMLFLGDGTGGFAAPLPIATPLIEDPLLFDLDDDGHLDLLSSSTLTGSVAFLTGDGQAGFAPAREIEVGFQPEEVRAGDVDGDGIVDLVVLDCGWADVTVVLGKGGGEFETFVDVSSGEGPVGVAAGDLDLDGAPDVVTVNAVEGNVSVLFNDGAGGFGAPLPLAVGGGIPVDAVVADMDGQGTPDVAIASDSRIDLNFGDGAGGFPQRKSFPTAAGVDALTVGDLDGDGLADMLTVHSATDEIYVKENGEGPAVGYAVGAEPVEAGLTDLDGDGDLDAVVSAKGTNEVWLFLGDGSGGLETPVTIGVGAGPMGIDLGDLNADGLVDLVTANFDGDNLSVLIANGLGGFGNPTSVAVLPSNIAFGPVDVIITDVTRDGTPDLVSDLETILLVHPGAGGGTFDDPVRFASSPDHVGLETADFDLDGSPDLLFAASERDAAAILLHRGLSGSATPYGSGLNPIGSLILKGAAPARSAAFELRLDNPLGTQTPGSLPLLALSLAPDPAFPAGTFLPNFGMLGPGIAGELLISLEATDLLGPVRTGAPWAGAGFPSSFVISVPDDPTLVGLEVFTQGLLLDGAPGAVNPFGLTEAIALTIGSR